MAGAQAMMGPTQMLFIGPAVIAMMPGVELTAAMAFVPVLNVTLALEAMLKGEVLLLEYSLTAFALLLQAWLAITISVRLLSREKLALAEGGAKPRKKRNPFGFRKRTR